MSLAKPLGSMTLSKEELREDKKTIKRYDQCGLGKKAIYVGGKLLPRRFYIPYGAVTHVYRRVAVSPGSGKGFLTPILYIVVRYDDGKEAANSFRYITDADKMMEQIQEQHPSICLLSPDGEKKKKEREALDERIRQKKLSEQAQSDKTALEKAKRYLEMKPGLYAKLSGIARVKRTADLIDPRWQILTFALLILGLALIVLGAVFAKLGANKDMMIVMMLLGAALMFMMGNSKALPTRKRNRKKLQKDYDAALLEMETYLKAYDGFPVDPHYAHPYVLSRLIRILQEQKADSCDAAMTVLKDELKAADHTVALTGDDYKEVVTIKPLFLVNDYR